MKPRHLLTLPLALIATPVLAQDLTPTESAQVDTIVADALAGSGVPSASVAIVRGGKIVFAKAYGKQSETMTTASADRPYQIASISKQFTAAALLMLEDEGKLSLDDTVSKWVPGISGGDKIKLRQLLSHTSGLQDYWPQDYSFAAMAKPTTPQGIVDRWAKKPLDFDPGAQWQYSNTGYVVAGLVAEKAAGKPLLAYLQEKVFKPLGMTAIDQDKAIGKKYPQGYKRNALGPVRVAEPAAAGWLFAAGELSMSASDLAKWDIARMNRTLLPADDWQEQETPVKLTDGKNSNYGLGVSIGTNDGRKVIEHSGEAVGFLSENVVFPDDKAAVVVLVNGDFSDAYTSITGKIAKLILPPATAAAAPANDETAYTARARTVFDQVRAGTIDRSAMTDDLIYYFNPTVTGDYRESLTKLGDPTSFALRRPARLRGGFVNRNYLVTYPDGRKLSVVTYAEPAASNGAPGRYEQFMVMPAE
ncbi:beta-lactamase family protein [Sphingomonas panacisoli]|uniref:Beta-lactamase family protein n=1 Tax=Sphingomonas panacisoli TaxID=1813879 RepID=A0A5B8LGI9_9SPHN|nr:serine hydrolase domain-containing protein [Sphingomonas panacisoli]QDZ07231.1 beta-lactamase family protein [Sphingomonas panacisoli]